MFVDIRLNLPKSSKSTETARKAMKKWYLKCRERDSDMILYRYEKKNEQENDALTNPNNIPDSVNQIDMYFNGYRPKSEAGISYMSARIGFNLVEDTFFADCKVLLQEDGHSMYKKNIQAAHTENVGWLWGSYRDMDIDYLRDWLETIFINYDIRNKVSRKEPLKLGLWNKPVWDGTKKSDRPAGKKGVFGVHLDGEMGNAKTIQSYTRKALASPEFKKSFGIRMHLIPRLTFRDSPHQKKKFQVALQKHSHLVACLERAYTWELGADIEHDSQKLGMVNLRALVFRWKAKGTEEQLFVGIDKKWGKDGGYTFTFPKKFEPEAREKLACLPAYLHREHGDEIFRWFTPDAKERALAMEWDDKEERPISTEESYLDSVIDQATSYTWLDMSAMETSESTDLTRPEKAAHHTVELDMGSLSTFGTRANDDTKEMTTVTPANSHPTPPTNSQDTSDDMSLLSFQSRVSTLELSVSNVQGSVTKLAETMNLGFARLLQAQGLQMTPGDPNTPAQSGEVPRQVDTPSRAGDSSKPSASGA
jgi:hypothetical protein